MQQPTGAVTGQQTPSHRLLTQAGTWESHALLESRLSFEASAQGKEWAHYRQSLPVWSIRNELLHCLGTHDVAVVGGDTGSGKTTQVPHAPAAGLLYSSLSYRAGTQHNPAAEAITGWLELAGCIFAAVNIASQPGKLL